MRLTYRLLLPIILVLVGIFLASCSNQETSAQKETTQKKATHTFFQLLDSTRTNISFTNRVEDQAEFNILTYRNFYNGGGVAIGDVNNDGYSDLYFTANQQENKLYLNKGDWTFEDATEKAGVAGTRAWSTGVNMSDVNGDGWMDIYVCNSGDVSGANKENELFINNQDGTFTERAEEYGLNNKGYSTQASFFDYDQDGDLDCYLLNNSFRDPGKIELFKSMRDKPDELGGDKLYRNDGNTFTDVTIEAGIFSSEIGFGLGAAIGDVNQDYLADIYVSNDFWERDYLYLNNGDGTFQEDLVNRIAYCSISSMGGDIADINNDGAPEIMSTDMLAADNFRLKAMSAFDPYHLENAKYRANYHYQFAQNCLHLNDGKGDFQEIGMLSNVASTDWSWGALIFDFENDGHKDIFVSNGIAKDIMSMDFRDFLANNQIVTLTAAGGNNQFQELIDKMPSNPLKNYAFQYQNNLQFTNRAEKLGLAQPSFSNGAAYGDLDNDGDLDLVVNNVNMPCFIYKNEANSRLDHHYLKLTFQGPKNNPFGIGAEVQISHNDTKQTLQNYNSRGFQSSIEPTLIFGLGEAEKVDLLLVTWPDKKSQVLRNISVDQTLSLSYSEAKVLELAPTPPTNSLLFQAATDQVIQGNASHTENAYNDFDHENLLIKMLSTEGPRMVQGDVNGDQLTDFILLGATDDEDKLFLQTAQGTYTQKRIPAFQQTKVFESTCGALFDKDGDGDLDLMLGAGGNEYQRGGQQFILRYFENDGKGNLALIPTAIPQVVGNFSCIEVADVDQDGDMDMFLGGRAIPGNYGLIPRSFLLANEGNEWVDITPQELAGIGMVTDAIWADQDQDGDQDLLVVGDWMSLAIFKNDGGRLIPSEISNSNGWWNRVEAADLDKDGDMDFVVGNWGLNSKFEASPAQPISMYVNDFDANKKTEFIINWYPPLNDQAFPFAMKPDLTQQIPELKKSILTYQQYAGQTYETLFAAEVRASSIPYRVSYLESAILWNEQGIFTLAPLPIEAQLAPVFGIAISDLDQDGYTDIWLGGNFYGLPPQVGRQDGSKGVFLKGNGSRTFEFVSSEISGIQVEGEVRDAWMNETGQLLVARNNASLLVFNPQASQK